MTPILGAIIDYYLDPIAEAIFKPQQSPGQVGFTQGISYLVAAVQRGESQRWAVDKKQICFEVSLDGEAAFPSVERDIQLRELYTVGERGDILEYSRNIYQNTYCHIREGQHGTSIQCSRRPIGSSNLVVPPSPYHSSYSGEDQRTID